MDTFLTGSPKEEHLFQELTIMILEFVLRAVDRKLKLNKKISILNNTLEKVKC